MGVCFFRVYIHPMVYIQSYKQGRGLNKPVIITKFGLSYDVMVVVIIRVGFHVHADTRCREKI